MLNAMLVTVFLINRVIFMCFFVCNAIHFFDMVG